ARKKSELQSLAASITSFGYQLGVEGGQIDDSLALLKAVSTRMPGFAPALRAMAVILGAAGRNEESLRAAEAAWASDNQSSAASVVLAYAESRMGLHVRAIETARYATRLAPNDDLAWLNLVVVLSKRC